MEDKNPPSYIEAIGLHSIIPKTDETSPSAPLLDHASNKLFDIPTLDEPLHGLSQTLIYSTGTGDEAFYVRDTVSCLYFKGMRTSTEVISLQDVNHRPLLRIAMMQGIGLSKKFVVSHNDLRLGTIQMTGLDASSTTIVPTLGVGSGSYKIQSHGGSGRDTDIVVTRVNNMRPLCKIHIPHTTSATNAFDASMVFPADAEVTNYDKCICLALPTIFMMIRRVGIVADTMVAIERATEKGNLATMFVCVGFVAFVGFMIWFIYAVTTKNCDAKPWPSKHCPQKKG